MFSSEFFIRALIDPEYKYARIAGGALLLAYVSFFVGQKSVRKVKEPYEVTCDPSISALRTANQGIAECINERAITIGRAIDQCVENERKECSRQLIEQAAGVPSLNCEICTALGYIVPTPAPQGGIK